MKRLIWVVAGLVVLLGGAFLALRTPDIPAAELRARYGLPQSEYLTVEPGLAVHVVDRGPRGAPVLILLHGSNASLHTWEPWTARLTDRYRVIAMDLPGHGLTGAHPRRDYSKAAFVAVVDAVARRKRLARFTLGGNSMGGGIAIAYAQAHPAKLDGLILVDAGGAPPRNPADVDLPIGFKIARLPVLRDIAAQITPRALIETSLKQSVTVQSVVTPAAVDLYWNLLRHPGNRAATMDRFAIPYQTADPSAAVAAVRTPALILWGRDDKLIPVASAAWFAATLPNARTVIYDGIGHLPQEEAPDRSAADVRGFLEALSPAPPSP